MSTEAPRIIRYSGRRHAWNDRAFRDAVRSGADATSALAALVTTGGRLLLPDQGEVIKLSSRVSCTANGLCIEGNGSYSAGATIRLDATNAGIDLTAIQDAGVENLYFLGSSTVIPTAGAALGFVKSGSNNYACYGRNLRFEKVFNAIDVNAATNTRLGGKIEMRQIHGTFGIRMYGSSLANRCDYLYIENPVSDAPYTNSVNAASWKGARATSTAYSVGNVVTSGGCIYECTTAGTSSAGSGPNGSHGTTGSRAITDGTVTWTFICDSSLAWILMDSFAYSLDVKLGTGINGAYAFRMTDSVASGSSYPIWAYFDDHDADHNAVNGFRIDAGEDFNADMCWTSSTLSSNGVYLTSGYRGEGGYRNGAIRGCAQHGALIDGGRGFDVSHNAIVDNGQAANNTYSNVAVGSNINGFSICHNKMLPITGQTTQMAKYPILVNSGTSDGYTIEGNTAYGHGTSNQVQDGGTGTNKRVELGDTTWGLASVWKTYTATVTSGTGTITTASGTGRYRVDGKTVHWEVAIVDTTNGTGATSILCSLPVTAEGTGYWPVTGYCTTSNKGVTGYIGPGGTTATIVNYDGTYPGSNGAVIVVGGSYERA